MARDDQGRKAGRNFASLRATFSRSTVTVNEMPSKEDLKKPSREELKPALPAQPAQLAQPAQKTKLLERRQSKYSLFDLFSKPKVQTARGYHESGLGPLPEQPPTPKQSQTRQEKPKKAMERVEPTPVRTQNPPLLRPVQAPPVGQQPPAAEHWDAPPLFQAYPQSIRHGTLQCPSASMDALARAHNLRKQVGFFGSAVSLPSVQENADGEPTQEAGKSVPKRYSTINETPELVDKMFVLVTAGRLVQYAGDGNYDRMPEKVLQLGEKSAAFACDLIPGKHWVVQVAQQVNAGGGAQINKSRSILSRLRNPVSARKSTASILLVFDSAEDMDAWLKAIRSVIERLGGAKKKDDGEARVLEDKSPGLAAEEQLSHRYRVSRPPSTISTTTSNHRPRSASSFSQPRSPRSPVAQDEVALPPVPNSTHRSRNTTPGNSPREAHFPPEVQSLTKTTAENSPVEASAVPSDQDRLDKLREGSQASVISIRTSRTSETDNTTVPTSKCSSSPPSPQSESFAEQQVHVNTKPVRNSYMAATSSARRLSVQPVSPVEIMQTETMAGVQQPPSGAIAQRKIDVEEPKPVETPADVLDNPRSRTSELYSHTLPARLRSSEKSTRPNSELMEPWTKNSRPYSVVGQLPSISPRSLSRLDSVSKPRRPLSRMLPVRPSEPTSAPQTQKVASGPTFYPRRFSSLPARANTAGAAAEESARTSTPEASTSSINASADSPDPSSTDSTPPMHRPRKPSLTLSISSQPSPPQQTAQQARALRRPTSMQIRSDPAPFLSKRRPSTTTRSTQPVAVANSYFAGSTPSNDFLPSTGPARASSVTFRENIPASKPIVPIAITTSAAIQVAPSPAPTMSPSTSPANPNRPTVRTRTSMPAMMLSGLPPPAPPPNMPLPSLPPNIPLPPTPSHAMAL